MGMIRVWNGTYNHRGDKRGCTNTHGLSKDPLYQRWSDMKRRCFNPKNKRYPKYGGRGITVCEEWASDFLSFYEWAISNGYDKSLTLDRIDVNGNYEPSNCRWIPPAEQMTNTTRNRYITIDGITKTMSEWAREYGVSPELIKDRILKLHWDPAEAVTTPKLRMGGKRWLKS